MLARSSMSAIFSPRATTVARVVLLMGCVAVVAAPAFAMGWVRTPIARGEHRRIVQPIPFDHRVHVTGLRIDCRYCHTSVERSPVAGLPSTQQCVTCHSATWLASAPMAPVRRSIKTGTPIQWRRVTQLPDFVYFDHSAHVNKGIGCESCHGQVDRMAEVSQAAPLTMQWCVSCHRDPNPTLRPAAAITASGHSREGESATAALAARYHTRHLTDCTTCHR
jgi:hypothetical protein